MQGEPTKTYKDHEALLLGYPGLFGQAHSEPWNMSCSQYYGEPGARTGCPRLGLEVGGHLASSSTQVLAESVHLRGHFGLGMDTYIYI